MAVQKKPTAKDIAASKVRSRIKQEQTSLSSSNKASVKVVGPQSNTARANINSNNTLATNRAKSGRTAREGAQSVNEANAAAKASGTSSAGTVKINSARVRTPSNVRPVMPVRGGMRISSGAGGGLNRNANR